MKDNNNWTKKNTYSASYGEIAILFSLFQLIKITISP